MEITALDKNVLSLKTFCRATEHFNLTMVETSLNEGDSMQICSNKDRSKYELHITF